MPQNISLEIKEQIAQLVINRPQQLNALNRATIIELHEALSELNSNAKVRAVVLTGSGEKAFVAGADIKEFADYSVNEGSELAQSGQHKLFDYIENFSKPVIAAVNGFALGGGLELAMACHIRVASSNARMGLPEVSLGVIPGYGGTQRLPQLVGKGRALEMIVTAGMVDANRAHEIGLVNHVVEQSELLVFCHKIGAKIAKNSPNAIEGVIKCVNAGFNPDKQGYKIEVEEFGKCFGTAEFNEGTSAFLEKRKAQF
jgi:enoyl-CoA hydratase